MFTNLREETILEAKWGATMFCKCAKQAGSPSETLALSEPVAAPPWRKIFRETLTALVSREEKAPDSTHPHVALVCANVYPQFNVCVPPVGGGMETRAALFGRGLAASERWRLGFVVSDFGQPFVTRHENIDFHIYQTVYRRAGRNVFPRLRKRRWFPILNLDRRDLALLWQIPLIATWLALPAVFFPRFWRRLRPDVVCCFGNNAQSAEVIADCRQLGIKTILCIASDIDISPDYRPGNRESNHYGMPKWKGYYSLANAGTIVVQTEAQQAALMRYFGRESTLIRNPVHISLQDPNHWQPRGEREFVMWIGRSDDFDKRPTLFLDLARSCPQLRFLMIVSRTDESVFLSLQSACPKNLTILEHVPAAEIWEYLARARIFVNTSKFEGFPNSFLQCAVMGVPVVSLEVDPDGILTRHGCGLLANGSADVMRQAVTKLWADAEQAEALAVAFHGYVLANHEAGGRTRDFAACLAAATAAPLPQRPPWWMRLRRFVDLSAERNYKDQANTGDSWNGE